MEITPYVSVLVPIYRVPENYLRVCIESLIKQTLKNIEIILVDDGSPDNCGLICDEYAATDRRIKVIHKDNQGLASARNSALETAVGECITFLDGDDYLELNACEVAFSVYKERNVQMVFWNQITEYPNSKKEIKTFDDVDIQFDKRGCKELQLRVLNFNGKVAQAFSKLISRKYLVENNIKHIDELSQGAEAIVFNIMLFNNLNSAYYLAKPLLHYRYNEQSISHTPNEKNYYMILRCFEFIEQYIHKCDNSDELEKQLYNRMLYVVVTTAITGYFNPVNIEPYDDRVNGFKRFLSQPMVKRSMSEATREGIGSQRKIILYLIKGKQYWIINLLGKLRRYQLANK